ncbi:hypothetical protein [uncultured Methanofollis sp.]|uniref:hypothetical protein n=1 Tax=uncultured Methanofollis sp. TaxID=262500 RepID=UPI00261EC4ED|nr:hypothetical protein [uncultured Methanofollis sp.]
MSTHATANSDGSISDYRVELTTTSFAYNILKQNARDEGYTSVRDYVLSRSDAGTLSYDEVWDGDTVTMNIAATERVVPDRSDWTLTKDDGFLVYKDGRFAGAEEMSESSKITDAMLGSCSLHYYLKMPGKIVDSNANTVKEKTAEWHLTGSDVFTTTIYAKSELPAFPLPGFGAVLAVLALGFLVWRRNP